MRRMRRNKEGEEKMNRHDERVKEEQESRTKISKRTRDNETKKI